MKNYVFSSESVTEGHPDKICDNVSDAILDALLKGDKNSRVAAETSVKTGFVLLAGEVTTKANVNYPKIVRDTIRDIGYTDSAMGFDADTCGVLNALEEQSPDISQGVTAGSGLHKEQGAGDQGLMFGYACTETPELMPAPIMYSHKLTAQLTKVRKSGKLGYLRPDGKSQVTVAYENGKPTHITHVVISSQHADGIPHKTIYKDILEHVIKKALPAKMLTKATEYHINPTGRFVVGGPCGDAGLTGRKIIVDTYGGMGRHGGGAFSGKDPSKVDRSACYYARFVAKNLVAAGVATRCEVQVAYAIGVAKPMGIFVDTFGTGKVDDDDIAAYVEKNFDFRPASLINELKLLRPIYRATAAYGHFGRKEFPWEDTKRAAKVAADLLGKKPASKKTAKKAPAKKTVAKKAPAKKTVAKKAPAKKSPRKS